MKNRPRDQPLRRFTIEEELLLQVTRTRSFKLSMVCLHMLSAARLVVPIEAGCFSVFLVTLFMSFKSHYLAASADRRVPIVVPTPELW